MKTVLIGNDIMFRWTIEYCDGVNAELGGTALSLYRIGFGGREPVRDFSAESGILEWTWPGREQESPGVYSFLLVMNEGEEGMRSLHSGDAVRLYAPGSDSAVRHCETACPCLDVETVELLGRLETVPQDVVLSDDVRRIAVLTQSEYDALEVKDGSTMYVIMEDTGDAAGQR